MLLKNNLSTGIQIIKCRLFSIKKPLFIGWNITEQCNYQCPFCNLWKKSNKAQELSTEEIKQGITYLKNEGTLAIAFGEGEPLLRNDIGEITKFCKKNRIITKINTNGSLVPEKINEIKNVNLIKMTLNGPRKIHDQERIPGAFDKVLTALETLKKNNINVGLNFVINKNNYQHINEMIYLAKNFNTKITFQPLEQRFGHNEYVENNFLSPAAHKDVFLNLINIKKTINGKYIGNSTDVLKYFSYWPTHRKNFRCWAGKLHFRVSLDGKICICDYLKEHGKGIGFLGDKKLFSKKQKPTNCTNKCWRNTTIELNQILSFNFSSLKNIKNIVCKT